MVAHGADTEAVLKLAAEVAGHTPGVLSEPPPVALFDPGYTTTHLGFKLIFRVESRPAMGGVQSAVRVALLQRFQERGIPLPSIQMVFGK